MSVLTPTIRKAKISGKQPGRDISYVFQLYKLTN